LHTRQVKEIDRILKDIFQEHRFEVLEGPFARTWDDESREYFEGIGIEAQKSDTMYTSVHYVLSSNSVTTQTCEVQVRTLMEEVWGEVDHQVNYPHKNEHVACREQIRALARVTSSATRLVDSIFATVEDLETRENNPLKKRVPNELPSKRAERKRVKKKDS
jgi:putative GTP pyrophosphokinase